MSRFRQFRTYPFPMIFEVLEDPGPESDPCRSILIAAVDRKAYPEPWKVHAFDLVEPSLLDVLALESAAQ